MIIIEHLKPTELYGKVKDILAQSAKGQYDAIILGKNGTASTLINKTEKVSLRCCP